jgi:uncharacterized protein (DUF1810 family)
MAKSIKNRDNNELIRFLEAQNQVYLKALSELKKEKRILIGCGIFLRKLKGLDSIKITYFYGIKVWNEATSYLQHPVLEQHLIEIFSVVLQLKKKTDTEIFRTPDDLRLRSE